MTRSRFDAVAFDSNSVEKRGKLKETFTALETMVERVLGVQETRAKAQVMAHLEEAFGWCGRAIRDQQIDSRGGDVT